MYTFAGVRRGTHGCISVFWTLEFTWMRFFVSVSNNTPGQRSECSQLQSLEPVMSNFDFFPSLADPSYLLSNFYANYSIRRDVSS